MKCPFCSLPLDLAGNHVDSAKAWMIMECEYSVAEDGEQHPPIPDEMPPAVMSDAEYVALSDQKKATEALIEELEGRLAVLQDRLKRDLSQMAIRELQILKPQPSPEDEFCTKWCKCIRCRQLRHQKASE